MRYALSLVMLSFLMCAPAQAYEVETGSVLICDTQEQVERFVQLFDEDQDRAVNAVNAEEHNPSACAVVNVVYVLGPQVGVARGRSHAFEIIGIAVIGMNTPRGFQEVKPSLYFTPVNFKEFAV